MGFNLAFKGLRRIMMMMIIITMRKDVEGSSLGVISVTNVPFPWSN